MSDYNQPFLNGVKYLLNWKANHDPGVEQSFFTHMQLMEIMGLAKRSSDRRRYRSQMSKVIEVLRDDHGIQMMSCFDQGYFIGNPDDNVRKANIHSKKILSQFRKVETILEKSDFDGLSQASAELLNHTIDSMSNYRRAQNVTKITSSKPRRRLLEG